MFLAKYKKLLKTILASTAVAMVLLTPVLAIIPMQTAQAQPLYLAAALPSECQKHPTLPECDTKNCSEAIGELNRSNCGIIDYLLILIDALSGLVGLVVVAVIIVAGIQFSTAGNDPQKITAAKDRIFNALLALVVFIFMFAFLQWVVPGGLF